MGGGTKEERVHERLRERRWREDERGREVNVDVWAVTVRYLRAPRRRAQAALVQVPLVCRMVLCLSVCLSVCLTQSHSLTRCLTSEFSYCRVHLDTMNNFSPVKAGMKRKQP